MELFQSKSNDRNFKNRDKVKYNKEKENTKIGQDITKTLFSSIHHQDNTLQNKKRIMINNPFLNLNKNKFNAMSDYTDILSNHNSNIEENLKMLKQLLSYRLILNDKITPYFIRAESSQHAQLIL